MFEHGAGSILRITLAQHWLQQCRKGHTTCRAWAKAKPSLPSRILDVCHAGPFSDPVLIEISTQREEYVTLSHRWGGSQVLTTTMATLETRKSGIPVADMPETFRHAVLVTRALGFRYLWIDSLCIIQDNLQDWELEAEKMGHIYQNSSLTISAVMATSADTGLFAGQEKNWPCFVGTVNCDPKVFCHPSHSDKLFAVPEHPLERSRQDTMRPRGPLDSRGWVLQEEVFSSRLLSFCHEGAFWECLEMDASDTYPDGLPAGRVGPMIYSRRFKQLLLEGQGVTIPDTNQDKQPNIYHNWAAIIENYTQRELTHESDRLIAVAGIANAMARITGDTYLAGLWKNSLISQLLWHVDIGPVNIEWYRNTALPISEPRRLAPLARLPAKMRRDVVSPSWTWATVGHGITWRHTRSDIPLAQVVSVAVKKVGLGAFTGRIKLRGVLRPVRAVRGDLRRP
jgi:hypothetical protein